MKNYFSIITYSFVILLTAIAASCQSQEKNEITTSDKIEAPVQIGEYVVATFEDTKGNLWFGTLEKGVAKYDGKTLQYLTRADGLPSNRIVCIIEDNMGDLWFGTGAGLSKYNGETFTNFSEKDGLCSDMISNLLIDSKGNVWIGTWGGVCQFDGINFKDFPIPYPTIETRINEDTKDWVTSIIEDSKGNIWICRDGYGACKYDGKGLTHFTKKDGLYSNNVQGIAEDKNGNIWFGSRVAEKDNPDSNKRFGDGGVTQYDGVNFIHFTEIEGLNENDVYEIYEDNSGNIWIGTISNGVYKYDGEEFENYNVPKSIMSITRDRKGNIWMGCAGGLYCLNSKGVVNVSTNGPWN
jgi:ligand-binding sensor domain-containing protein